MNDNLVIIPVFNERDTIASVLEVLCQHHCGDVLVVDDGSTDGSPEQGHTSSCTRIKILSHPTNQGYGATLIDGFQYAIEMGYRKVVTMDCDLQHLPQQVPEFFDLCNGCDILSGSRYLDASPDADTPPQDRMQINQAITERINFETNLNITDAFCGFKAYKVSALKKFKLDEPGYAMPLQIWIQAESLGLRIKEMPVVRLYPHGDRSFGETLDDPSRRLAYYQNAIEKELQRWKLT